MPAPDACLQEVDRRRPQRSRWGGRASSISSDFEPPDDPPVRLPPPLIPAACSDACIAPPIKNADVDAGVPSQPSSADDPQSVADEACRQLGRILCKRIDDLEESLQALFARMMGTRTPNHNGMEQFLALLDGVLEKRIPSILGTRVVYERLPETKSTRACATTDCGKLPPKLLACPELASNDRPTCKRSAPIDLTIDSCAFARATTPIKMDLCRQFCSEDSDDEELESSGPHLGLRSSSKRADASSSAIPSSPSAGSYADRVQMQRAQMEAKGLLASESFLRHTSLDGECVAKNKSWLQVFVMHPTSTPILLWYVIGPIVLAYDTIVIPMKAFPISGHWTWDVISIIITGYWSLDTVRAFFTGYETPESVEMRLGHIAKRYLRSWFLLDFTVCTLDWVLIFVGDGRMFNKFWRAGRALHAWKILQPARLVRFAKMYRSVTEVARPMLTQVLTLQAKLAIKSVNLLVICALLCHNLACYWYFLGTFEEDSWLSEQNLEDETDIFTVYLVCIYWSTAQSGFTTAPIYPTNSAERMFVCFASFIWMSVIAVAINYFSIWLMHSRGAEVERDRARQNIMNYLEDHNISRRLSYEIHRCFRVKYAAHRPRIHKQDIGFLKDLPLALHVSLHREAYMPLLKSHPFFKFVDTVSKRVAVMVSHLAVHETHVWSGQTVFAAGEPANFMINILIGRCEYYRRTQMNCTILSRGDWICEPALWQDWVLRGSLVASTSSELMCVDVHKFQAIVEDAAIFGKDVQAIQRYAKSVCEHFGETGADSDQWWPIPDLEPIAPTTSLGST